MKSLKYLLIIVLIIISFYITDRVMIYMENRHPIMLEIDARMNDLRQDYVNAIIENNTIIPGIKGRDINRRQSYSKMGEFGAFNETFIVFEAVRPQISLNDHKDKIIVRGNSINRQVALILEPNNNLMNHLEAQNVNFTIIANLNTEILREHEYIAGEVSRNRMSDLHLILNRRRVNSDICLIGHSNLEFCKERGYYLVSPSLDTRDNITELLTNIRSGEIILLRNSLNQVNLNLILNEIRRQDLQIVNLSELISEKR